MTSKAKEIYGPLIYETKLINTVKIRKTNFGQGTVILSIMENDMEHLTST